MICLFLYGPSYIHLRDRKGWTQRTNPWTQMILLSQFNLSLIQILFRSKSDHVKPTIQPQEPAVFNSPLLKHFIIVTSTRVSFIRIFILAQHSIGQGLTEIALVLGYQSCELDV